MCVCEEFDGVLRVVESAGGVEHGAEFETDVHRVDGFAVEPCCSDEGAEPLQYGGLSSCAGLDRGEPCACDDAVFADEGHDVGDCAKGCEREKIQQHGTGVV